MKVDLTGRVAVVTGGSGVLCSEMCRALAQAGAKVAVLGRNLDKAQRVADGIVADGGTAIAVSASVTDRAALLEAQRIVTEKLGVCDILINGAGGNHPKGTTGKEYIEKTDFLKSDGPASLFDLEPEGIESVFRLNFIGTLLPVQIFGKAMAETGNGSIINISSMNAFRPLTKIPAYSGAKAAVSNLTQWLAVYFSRVGVRVNAIAPGFFLTEQNRTLLTNPDGTLTARGNTILSHTPMGKFGKPADLSGALLFLLDDEASGFINGVVLPVDGGFAAFSGV